MKTIRTAMVAAAALTMTLAIPDMANAKGCLKGAAVGGVAGHVAGHHAVIGAAAGCAIEHHREKVRDRDAARRDAAAPDNRMQDTGGRAQDRPDAPR